MVFLGSFVNAVSGGGGLIILPTFLALGISPVNALALNRLTDIGVMFGACHNYFKTKILDMKLVALTMVLYTIGNYFGAKHIVQLPEEVLTWALLLVAVVAIVIVLYPFKRAEDRVGDPITRTGLILGVGSLFLIAVWNGAFAIAGGTVGILVCLHFFKKSLLESRGIDLFGDLPGSFIAAYILVGASSLNLTQMLVTVAASAVGAYIGSHIAIKTNGKIIRYFMVAIALLMIAKVAFDLLSGGLARAL